MGLQRAYNRQFDEHGMLAPRVFPETPRPVIRPTQASLEEVLEAELSRANDDLDQQDLTEELQHRCELAYRATYNLRDCISPEAQKLLEKLVRKKYGKRPPKPVPSLAEQSS